VIQKPVSGVKAMIMRDDEVLVLVKPNGDLDLQDTYGIEIESQYLIDPNLREVEEAIQEVNDTPPESTDAIRVIEGPEIIELPDKQPVLIEKPKGRRRYGPRYR